jgi:hypothetical protein
MSEPTIQEMQKVLIEMQKEKIAKLLGANEKLAAQYAAFLEFHAEMVEEHCDVTAERDRYKAALEDIASTFGSITSRQVVYGIATRALKEPEE